jgi:hypothetical protein
MPESDLHYVASLPRPELRNALRRAQAFDPPLRILAEDVLGADAPIDFIAVDPDGRVVLVLIGEDGEDQELLTQALAQRAWVRPRIRDWLQLAPNLELSASAPVAVSLLCPSFSSSTQAAAADLGPDVLDLSTLRCVRNGAEATVLLERLSPPGPSDRRRAAVDPPAEGGPRFRSGLTAEDLQLTPEEISEFN